MAEQIYGVIRNDQKDPKFGGGGETTEAAADDKEVKSGAGDGGSGYVGEIRCRTICGSGARRGGYGTAVRRIRLQALSGYSRDGLDNYAEILDFGRDANRLDYFRVTPFDVHGGNDLHGVANYGGGSGNSSNNGSGGGDDDRSVGPMLDRETGSTGAGGGDRTGDCGGELILDRERGSTDAGGIELAVAGVYANNGGGGGGVGEVVEQERENDGAGDRMGQVLVRSFANKSDGDSGGGGFERWIDGEEVGGGLVVGVVGWWKKWWWFLALWK